MPETSLPEPGVLPRHDHREGRLRWQRDDLTCWCVPALEAPLRAIYLDCAWVYDALRSRPDALVLPGRLPVVAAPLGPVNAVVKRLHHGGLLAPLTGDRFLSPVRFLANLRAADKLAAAGIPTPRILFVAWRRVAGWVRGEIGTEYLPGGQDASDALFSTPGLPGGWEGLVDGIATLVLRLHNSGVLHQDLNLRNFLITPGGELLILDLDKVRHQASPLGDSARQRNLARLTRSIVKQGRGAGPAAVGAVVDRLAAGYQGCHA